MAPLWPAPEAGAGRDGSVREFKDRNNEEP